MTRRTQVVAGFRFSAAAQERMGRPRAAPLGRWRHLLRFAPLILALWPNASFGQAPPREDLDLAYSPTDSTSETTLSVFYPPTTEGAPVLTFFHGGGWRTGDKSSLYDLARRLAAEGVVAVVPNYRLAPGHQYPSQLEDAAAAVTWVAERLAAWQVDTDCAFVGGHSAGAHLAALLASGAAATAARPPAFAGVVAVSGVFNIAPKEGGATPEFIASVFGADDEVWRAASPAHRVATLDATAPLPPFALIWASGEHPLAVRESVDFAALLRRHDRRVLTAEVAAADHAAGMSRVSAALLDELSGGACSSGSVGP
jgi:arylformamidase